MYSVFDFQLAVAFVTHVIQAVIHASLHLSVAQALTDVNVHQAKYRQEAIVVSGVKQFTYNITNYNHFKQCKTMKKYNVESIFNRCSSNCYHMYPCADFPIQTSNMLGFFHVGEIKILIYFEVQLERPRHGVIILYQEFIHSIHVDDPEKKQGLTFNNDT